MAAEPRLGPPHVRRRLAGLRTRALNFDPDELRRADPDAGWALTDRCQALRAEAPGPPVERGTWETARRVMQGYEFADPTIVRAYYDADAPLEGRDMLLELRALGLFHLLVGVRVGDVYDRTADIGGRAVRIWGWNYRTLEGHVEAGQMDWEVWKWIDTGEVEFRIHSVSRPARIVNPFVRIGFRLLRGHERQLFLESTKRRMLEFTELARER